MMEHLEAEGVESQNQLPQLEQPDKGTTFLKTCFNGVNTLSGLSLSLSVSHGVFVWRWNKMDGKFLERMGRKNFLVGVWLENW